MCQVSYRVTSYSVFPGGRGRVGGGTVSHGEGVYAARGSVKYHLPRCREVDGSGGWEFTESVGDEVRGILMIKMAVTL